MNTCRTCQHANTKPGHTAIYSRGFRNCAHLPTYQYVSGSAECRLNPPKWEQKK
jgi:hypothetical protein